MTPMNNCERKCMTRNPKEIIFHSRIVRNSTNPWKRICFKSNQNQRKMVSTICARTVDFPTPERVGGRWGGDVLRQDYPRSGKSLNSNISFTMEQECESDRNLYGRPFVFDAITDLFLEVWRWGSWIALYNQIVMARKFIHPVTINTYVALLKS